MEENKLSFESKNLVVDYISFNISGLRDPESIANYLFNFGFNSMIAKGNSEAVPLMFSSSKNDANVFLRQLYYNPSSNNFWEGISISFAGVNAAKFYKLLKEKKLDLNVFNLDQTNIGRIDIKYFRESKLTDTNDCVETFMEKCRKRLAQKSPRKCIKWKQEENGLVLRIGQRSSGNYYRVYKNRNGLIFEIELKKKVVKSFQEYLFDNRFKKFENNLCRHFYGESQKSLHLNSCCMDWFLDRYRRGSSTKKTIGFLMTYLRKDTNELSLNFLRFLSFLQTETKLSYTRSFEDQLYYVIEFPIKDFMVFIDKNPNNNYQRKNTYVIIN